MTRYSVAVRPSASVVAALTAMARPDTAGVHWSGPEQWIVKLRPLGHVPDAVIQPLVAALRTELDGAPVVACSAGPTTERLAGQWLGLPVTGLDELATAVFEATEVLVPVTHPQPFHAVLVLARGRVPTTLASLPFSSSWTSDTVAVVADRSGPGRPRLVDVAQIPLG